MEFDLCKERELAQRLILRHVGGMRVFASLLSLFLLSFEAPALCLKWGQRETLATLPNADFSEISGMAYSPNFPGRIYFVNDSSHGAYFYSYDLNTGLYEKIEIEGFKGWDIEALSFGPCGKNQSCIYIADVGDNQARRKIVRIAGVVEKETFKSTERPLFHKILKYPDQATDAEAIVVSSRRNSLYLFSKEFGMLSSAPTKVYQISLDTLHEPQESFFLSLGEMTLKGGLMTPLLTVTDAALSSDESTLFLTGYVRSYEVSFDDLITQLENSGKASLDYTDLSTGLAVQTEAASYAPDGSGISWTYESHTSDAPIYFRSCDQRPDSGE